jgi:hypothetical protein
MGAKFTHKEVPRPLITINPWSRLSLGSEIDAGHPNTPATGAWPSANRALYIPFQLHTTETIVKAFVGNGGTASGNFDVGIYNAVTNARLVSSGSTAMSGTTTLQIVDIADTTLTPGYYYMALAVDNTTAQFTRITPDPNYFGYLQLFQEASAFALPATATPAAAASAFIPFFGLSLVTNI